MLNEKEILEMVLKLGEIKEYDFKLFQEINRLIDNSLELKMLKDKFYIQK